MTRERVEIRLGKEVFIHLYFFKFHLCFIQKSEMSRGTQGVIPCVSAVPWWPSAGYSCVGAVVGAGATGREELDPKLHSRR